MTIKHGVAIFSLESAVYETSVAKGIEYRAWQRYKDAVKAGDLDVVDASLAVWQGALATKRWCDGMLKEYQV